MDHKYLLDVIFRHGQIGQDADAVMDREDFREYVSVNGYHFSERLASCAISHLRNFDGTDHKWSVTDSMSALGSVPDGWTAGDAAYMLNRVYREMHVKGGLATEADVIAYARKYMQNADNRDGAEFIKWTSEMICSGNIIEWYKFN